MEPSISHRLIHIINNCEGQYNTAPDNTIRIVKFVSCVLSYGLLCS